jgi:hypothetical protein
MAAAAVKMLGAATPEAASAVAPAVPWLSELIVGVASYVPQAMLGLAAVAIGWHFLSGIPIRRAQNAPQFQPLGEILRNA